jgi:hypothetical protein
MRSEEYRAAALARAYANDLGMCMHHAAIVEAFTVYFKNERFRGLNETRIQARFIESFQAACQPGWAGVMCPTCAKTIDVNNAWVAGSRDVSDIYCSRECIDRAQRDGSLPGRPLIYSKF